MTDKTKLYVNVISAVILTGVSVTLAVTAYTGGGIWAVFATLFAATAYRYIRRLTTGGRNRTR